MSQKVLAKICTVVLLFIMVPGVAQLTVTTNANPTQLAQKILGKGITVLNAQYRGGDSSAGIFKAVHGSFLIDSGIVLTTGNARSKPGVVGVNSPASSQSALGTSPNNQNDPDLKAYGGGVENTNNECILEFDFIPQGDSIYIRYIFGSEEYPDFVCSQFNDVFAFFISGPGYLQKRNIATVPGAPNVTPVTINTVNSGVPGGSYPLSNCQAYPGAPFTQYFVNNSSSAYMVYNGNTVVLTARAKVTPCQTYHIKIGVADLSDQSHDSGVFIEANSFMSKKEIETEEIGPYTDPQNNNNVTMIEACKTAQIKLKRNPEVTGAFSLTSSFGSYPGTAVPNVDFTTDMPTVVAFAANETEKVYNFTALADAVNEGLEKVVVRFAKGTCTTTFVDSAILFIRDSLIYRSKLDTSFCIATPITIAGHDTVASVTNTWTWNTGENTRFLTINNPGSYTVTHVYSQRCLNVDTFNVVSKDPAWTFNNSDVFLCPGESTALTLTTDATNISWNTGATSNSINVNAAGDYWVTASNTVCTRSDTVSVFIKPKPAINLGIDTGICQNQTILLDATYTASPGATSVWNTGATTNTLSVSTAGEYWVENTLNGCTARDTINITVNPLPLVNLGIDTSICEDKTLQLNGAYTGATQTWSTGATSSSITVSADGEYWVENSLNGCKASDTINVATKPLPLLELGTDRSICQGQTTQLDATYAGATYSWSNGATSGAITVTTTGKYVVTSTLNGCDAKDSVNVLVNPIPVVDFGNDTSFCENANLVLNATFAGATHSWNTGATSPTLSVTTPGEYWVVNTLNGCIDRDTINVTTKSAPGLELGADRSICQGQASQLDATYAGATYSWSNGATSGTITVSTTGKYIVTSTLSGCDAKDSVNVLVNPIPVVDFGDDTSFCDNVALVLNAAFAGASHTWNTGANSPTLSVTTPGPYWVVNTLNGCTDSDTINVAAKSAPLLELGPAASICNYESLTLSAAYPGATYLWNNGDDSSAILVTNPGIYSVISTLNGCDAKDTIIISAKKMPVVNAGLDMIIQQNTTAQLNATHHSNNASYLWSPASTLSSAVIANPVATPTQQTTEYMVQVTSVDGCVDDDKMVVRVVYPITIPNAFSPNGDGINDKWVITNLQLYVRSRVNIFNRYGQQVYSGNGDIGPWDGSFKGRILEPATYYYVIDLGDGKKFTGYVVLLR